MFNKILFFLVGAALFAIQVENVSAGLLKRHIQPHLKIKPAKINPEDLIDEGHKLLDEVEQDASWSYNLSLVAIEAGLTGFNITANGTLSASKDSVEIQGEILLLEMERIWWDNELAGIDISSCYDPSREKLTNYINETVDGMLDCMYRRWDNTVNDLVGAEEDIKRIYNIIMNLRRAFDRCRDDKCRQEIIDQVNEIKQYLPALIGEIAGLASLTLIHDVNLFEICLTKGFTQITDGYDIIDELTACINNLPLTSTTSGNFH